MIEHSQLSVTLATTTPILSLQAGMVYFNLGCLALQLPEKPPSGAGCTCQDSRRASTQH